MNISPATTQHAQLVKNTQKWVAQTFYGTLLKQVRESPFKNEMLSGGRGGQAFGSMLDMQMAERMTKSAGSKLVNSIVRKIEKTHGLGTGSSDSTASGPTVKPIGGVK